MIVSPDGTPMFCLHCKRLPAQYGNRGLCASHYRDRNIRRRYPRLYAPQEEAKLDASELKPVRPDRCEHGIKDGLCPTCERAERARMAIATMEEE